MTQLDPGRDAAWKRLGFKRQSGRWLTDGQLAAEQAGAEAQRKADKHWITALTQLRDGLANDTKRAESLQCLGEVSDPRAVPAVWVVFAVAKPPLQKIAVQLFGQIDSAAATRALSILAVASTSGEVRSIATQTLRLRDPRDAASVLVALLAEPVLDTDPILYHYFVQPVGVFAIGSPGVLFVRGPRYDLLRYYTVDDSRSLVSAGIEVSAPSPGYPLAVWNQSQRQAMDLAAAVQQILRESEPDVTAARLQSIQVGEWSPGRAGAGRGDRQRPGYRSGSRQKVVDRGTRLRLREEGGPTEAGLDVQRRQAFLHRLSSLLLLRRRH